MTFGLRRHQGGRISDRNRTRSRDLHLPAPVVTVRAGVLAGAARPAAGSAIHLEWRRLRVRLGDPGAGAGRVKAIPVSSVALVLGIHRVLSAEFVFTDIAGDCIAALVVGKWEKAVERERLRTELDAGYQAA